MRLFELREFLIKREAIRTLRISATRRIRAGDRKDFVPGCEVDIYDQGLHRWLGGFAVLGRNNSHLLAGKGRRIAKHPVQWTRLKYVPDVVAVDNNETASKLNENGDRLSLDGDNGAQGSTDVAWTSVTAPVPEMRDGNDSVSTQWGEEYLVEYTDVAPSFPRMPSTGSPSGDGRIRELYLSGVGEESDLVPIYRDCWSSSQAVQPLESGRKMSPGEENHLLSQTNPSRMSPRIFLQIPGAITAIEEEINMLVKAGK